MILLLIYLMLLIGVVPAHEERLDTGQLAMPAIMEQIISVSENNTDRMLFLSDYYWPWNFSQNLTLGQPA